MFIQVIVRSHSLQAYDLKVLEIKFILYSMIEGMANRPEKRKDGFVTSNHLRSKWKRRKEMGYFVKILAAFH